MFKASLRILNSSKRVYLFVALQLITVFIVCIFMASSVYSRVEYYIPLKDILNSNGSAVKFKGTYTDNGKLNNILLDYRNTPIKDDIPKIDEVYTRYAPAIKNKELNYDIYSYDKNVSDMYTPYLKNGIWLNSYIDLINGNIPAVIFQNNFDYQLGDIISGSATTYNNENIEVKLQIVGILDEESKIYGNNHSNLMNHLSLFDSPNERYEAELLDNTAVLLILVPNEITEKLDIVSFYDSVNSIVTYDESVSERDNALNTSILNLRYGFKAENIGVVNERSERYIKSQLFILVPISICIVIMALVSSICTSAVITKKNMHKYLIYYLCGMRSRQIDYICMINSLIISAISLSVAYFISFKAYKTLNIAMQINQYSLPLCVIIALLFIALSMVIPHKMIKNNSLRGLLIQK